MSFSSFEIMVVLAIVVIGFAWRDLQDALSLEELKDQSSAKDASAYEPLALLSKVAPKNARVWLSPITEPNAFVASGREIFVTQGLEEMRREGAINDRQMAAIIAHEFAHLICGHYARRKRRADAETIGGVIVNRFGMLGRILYSGVATLSRAKLSQAHEFEADARAAKILVRCGLSGEDLAGALAAFDRLSDGEKPAAPAWLASHPPNAERIRRLRGI